MQSTQNSIFQKHVRVLFERRLRKLCFRQNIDPREKVASIKTRRTEEDNNLPDCLATRNTNFVVSREYRQTGRKRRGSLLIEDWPFETIERFVGSTKVVTSTGNVFPSGSGYVQRLTTIRKRPCQSLFLPPLRRCFLPFARPTTTGNRTGELSLR